MKEIKQRVKTADVRIEDMLVAEINKGLVVLLGIAEADDDKTIEWILNKIINLRVFPDENDVMNISLKDAGADLLIVSNFTVYGDTKKGFRPSWSKAAPPQIAEIIYDKTIAKFKEVARQADIKIQTGQFQAMMDVSMVNWGPVTLIVEK